MDGFCGIDDWVYSSITVRGHIPWRGTHNYFYKVTFSEYRTRKYRVERWVVDGRMCYRIMSEKMSYAHTLGGAIAKCESNVKWAQRLERLAND